MALSQDEVAFLLGAKSGAGVCRYEQFEQIPKLKIALAFEIIYKRAASELFGGLYEEVEREIGERARTLLEKAQKGREGSLNSRKREALANLAKPFVTPEA